MFILKKSLFSCLLLVCFFSAAMAQEEKIAGSSKEPSPVTAAATGERVRFTASSSVVQLRLEVYDASGRKLFDNELRGGNVLDWHLQDGRAEPLADDAYLCVVTVKSLSGKLTQRIGMVRVEKMSALVRPFETSQITAQQAQAIGPVEENASLIVLKEDDNQATTVVAHNGEEGQITRGRGALSFRLGDFFSGKDTEQMRLTAEGNLGIGIAHPQVRLDVDGLIRATRGIVFPDGSVQFSAARKTFGAESLGPGQFLKDLAGGQEHFQPQAAGTGTQNFLAKWAESGGTGTLTNSAIFESGGNVGIGTAAPSSRLHLSNATGAFSGLFLEATEGDRAALYYNANTGLILDSFRPSDSRRLPILLQPNGGNIGIGATSPGEKLSIGYGANTDLSIGSVTGNKSYWGSYFNNVAFTINRRVSDGAWANPNLPTASIGLYTSSGDSSIRFGTSNVNNQLDVERMRIDKDGRVGIGTPAPTSKLTVAGLIETTTGGIKFPDGTIQTTAAGGGGGGSFIQNQTTLQTGANFNIDGTGKANIFAAATQYNIGGDRVLSADSQNTFAGVGAGSSNTTGFYNSFLGDNAGSSNTTGIYNSFFGAFAGSNNTTGRFNSFFGEGAGSSNTTANYNSFFGDGAGFNNQTGFSNSFFGESAGLNNTTGDSNSFFGDGAGYSNQTASYNAFFGKNAGHNSTNGANSFFGGNAGYNNGTGSSNSFFGTCAGCINTAGLGNSFFGASAGNSNTTENYNTFIGYSSTGVAGITNATAIGAFARVRQSNSIALGSVAGVNGATASVKVGIGTDVPADTLEVNGIIRVAQLGTGDGGNQQLCRNSLKQIAACGSSLRYKEHLSPFPHGLELINRLRPISFTWKADGQRDIGLAAEEVEKVEPLLVTYNAAGKVEGVKYDRINLLLINAVRQEQQELKAKGARIASLEAQSAKQEARLSRLESALRRLSRAKYSVRNEHRMRGRRMTSRR